MSGCQHCPSCGDCSSVVVAECGAGLVHGVCATCDYGLCSAEC